MTMFEATAPPKRSSRSPTRVSRGKAQSQRLDGCGHGCSHTYSRHGSLRVPITALQSRVNWVESLNATDFISCTSICLLGSPSGSAASVVSASITCSGSWRRCEPRADSTSRNSFTLCGTSRLRTRGSARSAHSSGPPFVYGPVGGGGRVPWRLFPSLGARGITYEVTRATAKLHRENAQSTREARMARSQPHPRPEHGGARVVSGALPCEVPSVPARRPRERSRFQHNAPRRISQLNSSAGRSLPW